MNFQILLFSGFDALQKPGPCMVYLVWSGLKRFAGLFSILTETRHNIYLATENNFFFLRRKLMSGLKRFKYLKE